MTAKTPRVFSIPPTAPFLERLADALLSGTLVPGFPQADDPLALARATVFLPTRRACRSLADIFREKGFPLLPKLRPLGDANEDETLFRAEEEIGAGAEDLPPAIAPLTRQMILGRMVLQWTKTMKEAGDPVFTPASPADSLYLAGELARLLDMLANENLEIGKLQDLPPLDLQQHWESAYRFLKIASETWPTYLKAAGQIEPAQRRRLLMHFEAERLMKMPDPVIAAGSTGSIPVTAEFLAQIAQHPQGALVLPGLDHDLDEKSWDLIGKGQVASHPQTAMAALLGRLKIVREDVLSLEENENARLHAHFISEVMRPAETSEAWGQHEFPAGTIETATAGLSLVEAAHEHEEALTIACILRETLEQEHATAALVTPDRTLARQVASELKRFGLHVDDSSGIPLNVTQAGIFARLVSDAALHAYESASCLGLLRHSLCALTQDPEEAEKANGIIERILFRGFITEKNTATLLQKFDSEFQTEAARGIDTAKIRPARERFARMDASLRHFHELLKNPQEQPLGLLLEAHREALCQCAATDTGNGERTLATSDDGKALLEFFNALQEAEPGLLSIKGADYPALFNIFMGQVPVRPAGIEEPRLRIYGLLEARLIAHDRLVLGGMNEGTWPKAGQADLWLSHGMRESLGLPSSERRIGLAAHDFSQALGGRDMWLTRSLKTNGAPAVPSRFVQRLAAVTGQAVFEKIRGRGMRALNIARMFDARDRPQPAARPSPSPPYACRPRSLSVTQIEALLRDPYTIYAEHILRLRSFEPLDQSFDARRRGLLIHATLSEFAQRINSGDDANEDLLEQIARRHFSPYLENAEVAAYWAPRFLALIPELAAFERERREKAGLIATEIQGAMPLKVRAGAFRITARADRIEKQGDRFAVIDFKSGQLPPKNRIDNSFALQLSLQAAMLEAGAFKNLQGESAELIYIGLANPDGLQFRYVERADLMAHARDTLANVQKLIDKFDAGAAYTCRADSPYAAYNDYLHLARLREWGLTGEDSAP